MVKAVGCGSIIRGFDSRLSPRLQFWFEPSQHFFFSNFFVNKKNKGKKKQRQKKTKAKKHKRREDTKKTITPG